MSKTDQCYLRWRGRVTGPFTWAEIERKLDAHEIGLLHDFQQEKIWITLGEYLAARGDTVRVAPNASVAGPTTADDFKAGQTPPAPAAGTMPKRIPIRWIYITLGFCVGFLGVHDFYAHHWIRGSLLLFAALVVWWLDWGLIWPWLVAVAESLVTKRDGAGRRMPWKKSPPVPPLQPPPSPQ